MSNLKYLGKTKTKKGLLVKVWYDYDLKEFYVEREDNVSVAGGWKIVCKPYKSTKEIEK